MNGNNLNMEVLRFGGRDEECTHLIHENNTTIFSSQGSHTKGSSKLTLKNFVNFNWDQCYYRGQLIALHFSEKYVAYAFTKPNSSEGLVRVVKRETNDRILIKGFSSCVEDLKFAFLHEIIMLACVDQSGSVYVYTISDDPITSLKANLVFQINEDPSYSYKNKHLISWCQYIPEQVNCLKELEFHSAYNGKMLAVVRGSEVEIWHIGMAINFTTGPVYGNLDLNELNENVLKNIKKTLIKIEFEDFEIVNVSFSPDGSNISLALNSGNIYFYEICFVNNETPKPPRRVFTWAPTQIYMTLRSMEFLDNHKQIEGDVELWKYVVTLTTNNDLLLWSCVTWTCLQKLTFVRCSKSNNPMKLTVDESGKFIFLSDIDFNLLYVLEVSLDINSPTKNLKIVCISEILLQSPMLNMIIVDAKIDHNDVSSLVQSNFDSTPDNSFKYTTIINLFAIQPKSIQEGQLIVSSPEISIMEHLGKKPNPPSGGMENVDLIKNEMEELNTRQDNTNRLVELSSMDLHKLVKEKLKVRGVNLVKKNVLRPAIRPIQHPDRRNNVFNDVEPIVQPVVNCQPIQPVVNCQPIQPVVNCQPIQPIVNFQPVANCPPIKLSEDNTFPQITFDMEAARECSPSNNEVQDILHNQLQEFEYKTVPMGEVDDDNYDYSTKYPDGSRVKEEKKCSEPVFNSSSIPAIKNPMDKNEQFDSNGIDYHSDISGIYSCLEKINSQLDSTLKKVKSSNDQSNLRIQKTIDYKLSEHLTNVTNIVQNSTKVDTDLFTTTLVTALSPTLDAILKDLFMSTVIPKFEQACCSMFKQIDASFTERSLEYQNELKMLLNEEGNINGKLEFAFDKFKSDVSCIVKHTEKNILSAQSDMQKQFCNLMKDKSLSIVESYVKETESVANQLNILGNIIDRGDHNAALEKALSASNLDLVLYVCERVNPDDFFQPPNELKTPITLSLIQQLSHDISINTELKFKYLDDAVASLDYMDDLYKENINLVLQKMEKNVEKFLVQHPFHAYFRKYKMLHLAVKTIINHIQLH